MKATARRSDWEIASGAHRARGDIALDATTICGTTCVDSTGDGAVMELARTQVPAGVASDGGPVLVHGQP